MSKSKFSPKATAEEVSEGIDLSGKLAIVTGASSGIGIETVRVLALRGAHVVLAVRDVSKGEAVAKVLSSSSEGNIPSSRLEVSSLDLSSFASVRSFAENFLSSHRALNLLINNAGTFNQTKELLEGHEATFVTNHLSHFLLTVLVGPALVAGAPSRVVSVSSSAHSRSNMELDDFDFTKRQYDSWISYGQSKTANILFTRELNRRLSGKGVQAFSLHPGVIATGLQNHLLEHEVETLKQRFPVKHWKTIPQGASTTIYAATSVELDGKGGQYLADNDLSENLLETDEFVAFSKQAPYSKDDAVAAKLWELSERLTGGCLSV